MEDQKKKNKDIRLTSLSLALDFRTMSTATTNYEEICGKLMALHARVLNALVPG
jgi:hypothetical protein